MSPTHAGAIRLAEEQAVQGTEVSFSDSQELAALNTGDFVVTVMATATNDGHPNSYCPLYFTSNPGGGSRETGLSIGHEKSQAKMEVRMADGGRAISKTFTYKTSLSLNVNNMFELRCNKTADARLCSLTVNGEPTTPSSASFACSRSIYNSDGGKFGNVWGWKFVGTLHSIMFADITPGPLHHCSNACLGSCSDLCAVLQRRLHLLHIQHTHQQEIPHMLRPLPRQPSLHMHQPESQLEVLHLHRQEIQRTDQQQPRPHALIRALCWIQKATRTNILA